MNKYSIQYSYNSSSTHRLLVKNIEKNKIVLDVGCNEGIIGQLSDKSNKFYGIDINPLAIEEARKYYEDILLLDLNKKIELPWTHKFDLIIFADVLEHLYEPKSIYFYIINNYLKPDGRIIISLPNIANWKIRGSLLLGRFNYTETGILDKTHLHFFTYQSAKAMFENDRLKTMKILGGSRIFGKIIKIFPFTKGLLAHNIVLIIQKVK